MPTYHPAYLLRNPGAKKQVWADVQMIMKRLSGEGMTVRTWTEGPREGGGSMKRIPVAKDASRSLAVWVHLLQSSFSSPALLPAAEKVPVFEVITVNAAITPPIAEYILQSIDEAAKSGAEGLIIRLDTPGGLDLAMRDIAKGILNAPVPVIVYVAPSGARAASAGADHYGSRPYRGDGAGDEHRRRPSRGHRDRRRHGQDDGARRWKTMPSPMSGGLPESGRATRTGWKMRSARANRFPPKKPSALK